MPEVLLSSFPATAELAVAGLFLSILIGVGLGRYRQCPRVLHGPRCSRLRNRRCLHAQLLARVCLLISDSFLRRRSEVATGRRVLAPFAISCCRPLPSPVRGRHDCATHPSSMLEVLNQDYIRTARSKGVGPNALLWKHALRNALILVITVLGFGSPSARSSAALWSPRPCLGRPGVARLTVTAVLDWDFALIEGNPCFGLRLSSSQPISWSTSRTPSSIHGFGTDDVATQRLGMCSQGDASMTSSVADRADGEPRRTRGRRFVRTLTSDPWTVFGGVVVFLFILVAIFGPVVAPPSPRRGTSSSRLKPPSTRYIFGTDGLGRDLLSRILYGARLSAVMGTLAVVASGSLGVLLGALAGYFEGWVDSLVGRFVDTRSAFPGILLAILVLAILGRASQASSSPWASSECRPTLVWCAARCCR